MTSHVVVPAILRLLCVSLDSAMHLLLPSAPAQAGYSGVAECPPHAYVLPGTASPHVALHFCAGPTAAMAIGLRLLSRRSPDASAEMDSGEKSLNQLGYKQELSRGFSFINNAAMSFRCVSSSLPLDPAPTKWALS